MFVILNGWTGIGMLAGREDEMVWARVRAEGKERRRGKEKDFVYRHGEY